MKIEGEKERSERENEDRSASKVERREWSTDGEEGRKKEREEK